MVREVNSFLRFGGRGFELGGHEEIERLKGEIR
jgi:hypothetical protein